MNRERIWDVFNVDADGLLARHQFRLAHPEPMENVTLVTGVKRDIALLARVVAALAATDAVADGWKIHVFDISFDRNADAVHSLLAAGAHIDYFDHHRAGLMQDHPQLHARIDESPVSCSSLLVDRHCEGVHRQWAIAAAFGDNLSAIAQAMAREAGLAPVQAAQLQKLGECLNYNAYGDSVSDLHYDPAHLAAQLQPYADPFKFIDNEEIVSRLHAGYESDMAEACDVAATHESLRAAVYRLPDAAWSRRVSGAFANHLVHAFPQRAHAVITADAAQRMTVSIRAPQHSPRDAATIATRFPGGGGRAAAAGIEAFEPGRLDELIAALEETYG
ncbi:MAG: hypothetical protein ABI905_05745 [Betaproteobacteria bacterium]